MKVGLDNDVSHKKKIQNIIIKVVYKINYIFV